MLISLLHFPSLCKTPPPLPLDFPLGEGEVCTYTEAKYFVQLFPVCLPLYVSILARFSCSLNDRDLRRITEFT